MVAASSQSSSAAGVRGHPESFYGSVVQREVELVARDVSGEPEGPAGVLGVGPGAAQDDDPLEDTRCAARREAERDRDRTHRGRQSLWIRRPPRSPDHKQAAGRQRQMTGCTPPPGWRARALDQRSTGQRAAELEAWFRGETSDGYAVAGDGLVRGCSRARVRGCSPAGADRDPEEDERCRGRGRQQPRIRPHAPHGITSAKLFVNHDGQGWLPRIPLTLQGSDDR